MNWHDWLRNPTQSGRNIKTNKVNTRPGTQTQSKSSLERPSSRAL